MSLVARVAVSQTAYHFDKLYDYIVPPHLEGLCEGCRVTVGFGASKKSRMGLVVELFTTDTPAASLKPLISCEDKTPALNAEGLALLRYLREQTFCTWYEALSALLPAGFGIHMEMEITLSPNWSEKLSQSLYALDKEAQLVTDWLKRRRKAAAVTALTKELGAEAAGMVAQLVECGVVAQSQAARRRMADETQTMVELCDPPENPPPFTEKQQAVKELLEEADALSLKEVCYYAGVTRGVVDKVVAAGIARYEQAEVEKQPEELACDHGPPPEVELSREQTEALHSLEELCQLPTGGTAMLYGVTGSGKTQVFLSLIRSVLKKGKTAIVLVPEIALTPQTISLFCQNFGQEVAVIHSGLSMGGRLEQWKRIKAGKASIVVGTRSAVFAPLQNLGLIVIDEEQEQSYHSGRSPRYDAREVAKIRSRYNKCGLVLCSATPSIESFYRAKSGDYKLTCLKERYGVAKLPDVTIIDMKEDESSSQGLSQTLLDELHHNLEVGEQSVLLLNRRGHSTRVRCVQCAQEVQCPHCSVSMTYHAANGRLVCHYCGTSTQKPESCPHCASRFIHYTGLGTQRAQEQLAELFPQAKILRMDADSTMSRHSHRKLLTAFGDGEYDILLGTQMVAKGLDFPNVTLVGVLAADQMLFADSFRSGEQAFSLITQVVGRCGRGHRPGRAFIQTYVPQNPIIELAATQQYEQFYGEEIGLRRLHLYPPFCRIWLVGFAGEDTARTAAAALRFGQKLTKQLAKDHPTLPIRLLGPAEATVPKVAGRYRQKLLLKCANTKQTRQLLSDALRDFSKDRANAGVSAFIDPGYDSGF